MDAALTLVGLCGAMRAGAIRKDARDFAANSMRSCELRCDEALKWCSS